MAKELVISPIFYMGNKKKLINKGLIELFPNNIDKFIDLFGGSGVVSLNTKANSYILNDIDENLNALYYMFKNHTYDNIINHIENNISLYGLAQERTKRNQYFDVEKLETYKNAYINLRSNYNKNKNVLDFYTLMFYSFSQQFRFNKKGEFNMPIGNDCFSEKNKEYIKNSIDFFKSNSLNILKLDFRCVDFKNLTSADFVYIDSPYFNTTATYNENEGWTMKDENDLLELCEELNSKGIKFGISNVFVCKGKINQHLIDWVDKNNFTVYKFDKFSYMACGKGNSEAEEVYICNY